VVLPAFEEGLRVADSIARVRAELAELDAAGDLQVVVVDDGSSDDTAAKAREAGADLVIVNPRNRGKGGAVKAGVAGSTGATVAFTDIDLAYAPGQIAELLRRVEAGAPVVVGSRWLPTTTTGTGSANPSLGRAVASRLFNVATFASVGVWRDTQCGLKAFDRAVASQLFDRVSLDGFSFDVEIFLAARAAGISVTDVPVTLDEAAGTTVRLAGQVRAVRDLIRLRRKMRRGDYTPGGAGRPAG